MSTKKKAVAKTPEPKALYSVNQKVFTIAYHKGIPEQLIEAKVWAVKSSKTAVFEYGKVIGSKTQYSYVLTLPDGMAQEQPEFSIYPSFFEAAKVFAKSFLTLLK